MRPIWRAFLAVSALALCALVLGGVSNDVPVIVSGLILSFVAAGLYGLDLYVGERDPREVAAGVRTAHGPVARNDIPFDQAREES